MEDFAGLVVFLVIIGLIERFSKKSKKNRNTPNEPDKKPAEPAAKKAAPVPRKNAVPVQAVKKAVSTEIGEMHDFLKIVEALKQAESAEKTAQPSAKPPVKAPQQVQFADVEGCVGGSIAHTQHEGESSAEHALHMKRSAPKPAEPEAPAASMHRLSTADLRKAVVMSEILDKPKALRRYAR